MLVYNKNYVLCNLSATNYILCKGCDIIIYPNDSVCALAACERNRTGNYGLDECKKSNSKGISLTYEEIFPLPVNFDYSIAEKNNNIQPQ